MSKVAKKFQDELEVIKKNVETSYTYFFKNNERFYTFKRFICATTLSADERSKLKDLKKPPLEFNTLEAYISRLLGEFATQEPSVQVRAAEGVSSRDLNDNFINMMKILEAHYRCIISDVNNDNLQYNIYNDQLVGGFSVMRVHTDYVHEDSFEQGIYVNKVFDPTLCGFDPLARESHKGDGRYCFEMSPYTKESFEEEFGKKALDGIGFNKRSNVQSFNWSYKGEREEIVLVVDYFVKKRKRVKIVKLSNNEITTEEEYKKRLKEYEESPENFEQAPIVVKERYTMHERIHLYRLCENKILDHKETNYAYLPLVFVDGNSVMLRASADGNSEQMTRPYVYHAKDNQKLRNFSGQAIAQHMESLVQHKIKVPIEAIPEDYIDAYKDVQHAITLAYNQFMDGDPNIRLDPPSEIVQTPPPAVIENIFMGADRITQSILGSYDAILGIGNKDVSGRAIQAGAIQSSQASDPYLVNYMKALNRVLVIISDLIPKYYKTPRTLPILLPDGKRDYVVINDKKAKNNIPLHYDPKRLNIKVEAGVNTQIEKQASLEMLIKMMQSSEAFAAFINNKGLPVILDNMDIRGIDHLKVLAEEFVEEQKKAAEAAQNQPDPIQIEAQTLKEVEEMKAQNKLQIEQMKSAMKQLEEQARAAEKAAELAIQKQETNIKLIEVLGKLGIDIKKTELEDQRLDAENARTAVEDMVESSKELIDEIGDVEKFEKETD